MVRICILVALTVLGAFGAFGAPPARPWMNAKLTPDQRADRLLDRMTLDEQISLLSGHIPSLMKDRPSGAPTSAGFVPGISRLGIPALFESDASLGVANAGRQNDDAVALPSGLAMAATFDPSLAYLGGSTIGREARQKGFNVLLSGGVDLVRDPRGGRNFEYLGEDPLLAGTLAAAAVRGVQSQGVISTIKHFAINDQEVGRMALDAKIGDAAARESDLMAFEIAVREGHPGSVMCAYNRVNGAYACENAFLLKDVLKRDWAWPGWVMSDWGAVHSVGAANAGLDQESGKELDKVQSGHTWFDAPLSQAVASGGVSRRQVREMAHRVLRSMFAADLFDRTSTVGGLNTTVDANRSGRIADAGLVLLKNDGDLLPLTSQARRIAVIGGHADLGVLSGGGSSQVIPLGSKKLTPPKGAPFWVQAIVLHPSSPLAAIRRRTQSAVVSFSDGRDVEAAATLARSADVAVVFATQWSTEGADVSLTLPGRQDALISAVARANPHTVVVLETGGPVLMPWLDRVGAVLEAWYPGSDGGAAIARALFGEVGPSGRLPVTFPTSAAELPRPDLPGAYPAESGLLVGPESARFDVNYSEGSDVGYRWYARTGAKPQFPFGYGLAYTSFRYGGLRLGGGRSMRISFTVTNVGRHAGIETPQAYLIAEPNRRQQRLIAWTRVPLKPGESRRVNLTAPARLLANWQGREWRVDAGAYKIGVGPDAATPTLRGTVNMSAAKLAP